MLHNFEVPVSQYKVGYSSLTAENNIITKNINFNGTSNTEYFEFDGTDDYFKIPANISTTMLLYRS